MVIISEIIIVHHVYGKNTNGNNTMHGLCHCRVSAFESNQKNSPYKNLMENDRKPLEEMKVTSPKAADKIQTETIQQS